MSWFNGWGKYTVDVETENSVTSVPEHEAPDGSYEGQERTGHYSLLGIPIYDYTQTWLEKEEQEQPRRRFLGLF